MNKALLKERTHEIFHRLSCEDPKFPRVNFFVRLMKDSRKQLLKQESGSYGVSEEVTYRFMKEAAQELVQSYEHNWQEIIGNWFPEDIFEALKPILEHIINKN